jgi:hypothetical protein
MAMIGNLADRRERPLLADEGNAVKPRICPIPRRSAQMISVSVSITGWWPLPM